ncbi:TPA: TaqI-like C-terminal specificity domain-containing protein, partial [Legionella pneumophila]
NKKRLGLGEQVIYDNPKIFIRQSAKEIVASYEEKPSAANNSLYVFSLRNDTEKTKDFLKFLCGILNSKLITFYAQKQTIIRCSKGKQPQIKTSDLYTIRIPSDLELQAQISNLVDGIYRNSDLLEHNMNEIDKLLFEYYNIGHSEIRFIEASIKCFG